MPFIEFKVKEHRGTGHEKTLSGWVALGGWVALAC